MFTDVSLGLLGGLAMLRTQYTCPDGGEEGKAAAWDRLRRLWRVPRTRGQRLGTRRKWGASQGDLTSQGGRPAVAGTVVYWELKLP